jgi:hypothetical protein
MVEFELSYFSTRFNAFFLVIMLIFMINKSIKKMRNFCMEGGIKVAQILKYFAYLRVMHNFFIFIVHLYFYLFFSSSNWYWLWQGLQVVFQWISSITYGFQVKLDCSKTGTGANLVQLAAVLSCCTHHSPLCIHNWQKIIWFTEILLC